MKRNKTQKKTKTKKEKKRGHEKQSRKHMSDCKKGSSQQIN